LDPKKPQSLEYSNIEIETLKRNIKKFLINKKKKQELENGLKDLHPQIE